MVIMVMVKMVITITMIMVIMVITITIKMVIMVIEWVYYNHSGSKIMVIFNPTNIYKSSSI